MSSTESQQATTVPERTTVLVVGAGPAGSYCSSVLAREGIDVVLLEAAKFPRYHIGESMLPSMRHYLRFIGVEEEFANHGFIDKPGATFKLGQDLSETHVDFSTLGPDRATWNVIRSEADNILFRHAGRQGASIFDETRVTSLGFENNGDPATSRPISAQWTNKRGESGEIKFDWLVDASGRGAIMCEKYLKNRLWREGLRNVAVWGYWKNSDLYQGGPKGLKTPYFEALTDESGWAWHIPLHDGTTSIGVVMHQNISNHKKSTHPGGTPSLTEHYLEQLKLVPNLLGLVGEKGELIPGSVKGSTDYSHAATKYSGDHFRVIGDAASFVDPFFSSGVHLALTGALSAASTICASIRGDVTEAAGQQWHDAKIGICHTRFLLVVLSAYKQMQSQSKHVLSDVNEENFDKAFGTFLPVIIGEADTKKEFSDDKLNSVVDFCINLFTPTTEEQAKQVAKKYQPDLLALSGPVLAPKDVEKVVDPEDAESKEVLKRINALKVLRNDTSCDSFGTEPVDGYVVRLEIGKLGLVKVEEPTA